MAEHRKRSDKTGSVGMFFYTCPALVLWFVHIPDKFIDLSIKFRRWENGPNALNSGPQLLYLRRNQVSGELLAAKAKLRSCVIHDAKVRPDLPSYELPKRFCPYFVQRRPRVR